MVAGQMGNFVLPGRRVDEGHMKKPGLNWDEMVRALTAFRKATGHCSVPTGAKGRGEGPALDN